MRPVLPLAALLLAACGHAGAYVWADDYRAVAPPGEYQLAPGDQVAIRVLNHDELSERVKVRSDGRISVPFVREVSAAGFTTAALTEKLTADFQSFINHPVVSVTVEEPKPLSVPVTGEVTRPGIYALDAPATVLEAIASAGGLTQFAHGDDIYVLRRDEKGAPVRIRFRYEALAHAEGGAATFALQRNDLVVVE